MVYGGILSWRGCVALFLGRLSLFVCVIGFFFSSRRRHTRWPRDWSSDVCSSDLGFGLGLCYIVPVATLIKWFPDKRGMITGLAVAGFGAGALVTAPVAQRLIPSMGLPATFGILGSAYLVEIGRASCRERV